MVEMARMSEDAEGEAERDTGTAISTTARDIADRGERC